MQKFVRPPERKKSTVTSEIQKAVAWSCLFFRRYKKSNSENGIFQMKISFSETSPLFETDLFISESDA
ncbi:MAG TPA: hypothetical protein DCX19_03190 [Alphaproteobacteria bacterium]|nr:hypothetical protein [Alphaproteobacteria bacterium]